MKSDTGSFRLDADWAGFLTGGVSMVAASRNRLNVPALARAVGCRISEDRRQVTVIVPSAPAAALLEAISASHTIAVVFSQPSTHRTLQLKGNDANPGPPEPEDRAAVERYVSAFVAELDSIGYASAWTRQLLTYDPTLLAAVQFTPIHAFLQTPGPRAGTPLPGDA